MSTQEIANAGNKENSIVKFGVKALLIGAPLVTAYSFIATTFIR